MPRRATMTLGFIALVLILPAVVARAEGAGTAARMSQFKAQLAILDSRAAVQYSDSVRLMPGGRSDPDNYIPTYTGAYRGPYLAVARSAAQRHGIPVDLFLRLVDQESRWNPGAISVKGAVGLAQLMPDTAQQLGVDPTNPDANLDGGARYLRQQFDRFGSWRLALAAYNAGPEAVEAHGDIPPYAETQSYVRAILGG